jgi:hypothetical protein
MQVLLTPNNLKLDYIEKNVVLSRVQLVPVGVVGSDQPAVEAVARVLSENFLS